MSRELSREKLEEKFKKIYGWEAKERSMEFLQFLGNHKSSFVGKWAGKTDWKSEEPRFAEWNRRYKRK